MSITITYTTPNHRYFMRLSKSEIINRIEQMRGKIMDREEYLATLAMTKDQIADEAMKLVRALPAPPDPVDTLVQIMKTEFDRQANADGPYSKFVSIDETGENAILDATFDLRALARAILEGLPK